MRVNFALKRYVYIPVYFEHTCLNA